jgi:flagellar basal-body rod modification protein FlgD
MIEAIGGNVGISSQELNSSSINQEDFIRLFLTQLTNQDPLEPVDNSEFLAQMAQFTSLEQSRLLNENMTNMLSMNSSNQGLELLGKELQVANGGNLFKGIVDSVGFTEGGMALTLLDLDGNFLTGVSLSDIRIVQE